MAQSFLWRPMPGVCCGAAFFQSPWLGGSLRCNGGSAGASADPISRTRGSSYTASCWFNVLPRCFLPASQMCWLKPLCCSCTGLALDRIAHALHPARNNLVADILLTYEIQVAHPIMSAYWPEINKAGEAIGQSGASRAELYVPKKVKRSCTLINSSLMRPTW